MMNLYEEIASGQEELFGGGDGPGGPPVKKIASRLPSLEDEIASGQKRALKTFKAQPYEGQYNLGMGADPLGERLEGKLPSGSDITDARAAAQPLSEKAGNALAKFVGKIGTSFLETAGDVLYGIPKAVIEGRFDAIYDNEVNRFTDSLNEEMEKALPLYRSRDEGAFTGIVPGSTGSANFWGDKVLGNVAQWIGPSLFARLATAPLKLSKNLLKLFKAANAEELFAAAAKAEEPLAELSKLASAARFSGAKERLLGATIAGVQESSQSSRQVKDRVFEELVARRKQELASAGIDRDLTEEETAEIERTAAAAGNADFAMQMPLIVGSNYVAFGKLAMGRRSLEKSPSFLKKIGRTAEGAFEATKPTRTGRLLGMAGKLETPASEFLQETSQYGIEQGTSDFFTKKYDKEGRDTLGEMIDSAAYGLGQAFGTAEGLEQGVIGAIMGGGIEAAGALGNLRAAKPDIDAVVNLLNDKKTSEAVAPLYEHLVRDVALQREKDKAVRDGDPFLYENADFDQFKSFVKSRIDAGQLQSVYDDLDEIKTFSEDDFKQAFGLNPNEPLPKSPIRFAEDVKKKVAEIDGLYGDINALYGELPAPVREYMFDAASNISNVAERESKLADQIKDLTGVDYEAIRRMHPDNYADVYIEELRKAPPKNPLDQDKLEVLYADMDRLAERREKFIELYNKLKTEQGQRDILAEIAKKEAEAKAAPFETPAAAPAVGDTVVLDASGAVAAKNVNILSENEDGTVSVEGVTPEGNRYAETVPKELVSEVQAPPAGEELDIGNVPLESEAAPQAQTSVPTTPVNPYFYKDEGGTQVRYEEGEKVAVQTEEGMKEGYIVNINGTNAAVRFGEKLTDPTDVVTSEAIFKPDSLPSEEVKAEAKVEEKPTDMPKSASADPVTPPAPSADKMRNDFIDAVRFYNKAKKSQKTPELKNKIKASGRALGFTITDRGQYLEIVGGARKANTGEGGTAPVENFIPISARSPEVRTTAETLLRLGIRAKNEGRNMFIGTPGFGINMGNMEGIRRDIASGKNTKRASDFLNYVKGITDTGMVEVSRGSGFMTERIGVPLDEYMQSMSEENYPSFVNELLQAMPSEGENTLERDEQNIPEDSVLKTFEIGFKDLDTDEYYEMQEEAEPLFVDQAVGRMVASLQNLYPDIEISYDPEVFYKTLEEATGERSDQAEGFGDPLGFYYQGKIFINPRKANTTTPMHEFGHVWARFAQKNDPKLFERGMKLVEGTSYLEKARRLYSDLDEADIKEEALAMAIGDKGAEFFKDGTGRDETAGNKFLSWLKNLFEKIRDFFGIGEQVSPEEVRDAELSKFSDSIAREILTGKFNFEPKRKANYDAYNEEVTERLRRQVDVWHGSPYDFDRFSMSAIGTGEGNQAFGWGLYFTDLEGIARNYAEKLRKGGEDAVVNNIAQEAINFNNGDIKKALEELNSTLEESWADKKRIKKAIKILETGKFKKIPKTNLYKVSLQKGKNPSEYNWLEWDKPFDNELRDKLAKKYLEFILKENKTGVYQFQRGSKWYKGTKIGDKWVWRDRYTNDVIDFKEIEKASEENFKDEVKGNTSNKNVRLYQTIANYYKSEMADDGDKFASLFLLENGIDGVKYPAESVARGATSDNARGFNYVVFDENAVTVEEKIRFQRGDIDPKEFEEMAQAARSLKSKTLGQQYKESLGKSADSLLDIIGKAVEPLDSSAYRVNKKVGAMLKQLSFEEGENIKNWQSAVVSEGGVKGTKLLNAFLKMKKANKSDFNEMFFRLNNGDLTGAAAVVSKYAENAEEQFEALKKVLEEIYLKAKEAGIDMGYVHSYFPTAVKDYEGLMKFLERDGKSGILQAIAEAERLEQLKDEHKQKPLTKEDKAKIVEKLLRGYKVNGVTLARVGSQKERTIDMITPEMLEFYHEPQDALLGYIQTMASSVAARNLFGKGANIDDSIAMLMLDLRTKGDIDEAGERKLTEILKARFADNRMDLAFRNFRSATYLGLLGNFGSAITQMSDLVFSITKAGLGGALNSYQKAWLNQSGLKTEDVHASQLADELKDPGKLGGIINTVFKWTGLSKMDRVGKETFINSSLERYQKLANTDEKKLREEIGDYFVKDSDVEATVKDFKDGTISKNVRYVLHADLSGIQPITKGAQPQYYHLMKNGKIFYALKSFTIVQLDFMRRKFVDRIISGIKNKDPKMVLATVRDFVRFAAVFALLGMGADELKRLLYLSRKRDLTLSDRVVENIIKLGGISSYTLYNAKKKGPGAAILEELSPATPVGFVDDLWNISDKPDQFFGKLPFIGRPIQYMFLQK